MADELQRGARGKDVQAQKEPQCETPVGDPRFLSEQARGMLSFACSNKQEER